MTQYTGIAQSFFSGRTLVPPAFVALDIVPRRGILAEPEHCSEEHRLRSERCRCRGLGLLRRLLFLGVFPEGGHGFEEQGRRRHLQTRFMGLKIKTEIHDVFCLLTLIWMSVYSSKRPR